VNGESGGDRRKIRAASPVPPEPAEPVEPSTQRHHVESNLMLVDRLRQ
jgi:hypothetical protein